MRLPGSDLHRKAWLLWVRPDGRRDVSWRMWVLVWILPVAFGVSALALAGEAYYRTSFSTPVLGVVDKVYAWPGTIPFTGRQVTNYSPRFVYTDAEGREVRATSGSSHPSYDFPVGTEMEIRYFPGRNANIVIPGPLNWFVAKVVALVALACLPLSLLGWWWLRRWQRKGQPT
ncbi:MAG TPA: hypothetical protein ENK41_05140 [Rhodobacteraceae bacterium]|nr:hypothetical protein [Paracoccaceae bacterium]